MKLKIFRSKEERAERAKKFVWQNKLFSVIVILLALFLIGTFLFRQVTGTEAPETTTEQTVQAEEKQLPHLRFYWSDLVILVVGGGFCGFKILQEKRRAKEKLQ